MASGTAGALWILTLIDRVTAPAGAIDRALGRTENRITRVTAAASGLTARMGVLAAAGEASARRVSGAWNNVHNSFRNSQASMQSLMTGMLAGAAALGAVGYAGKTVLDAAGLREMQITQISTLLGEKDPVKVKAAVSWINTFADVTPFSDVQTMGAVRQTLGYGFSFPDMQNIVRIMGDAASLSANDPADASYRLSLGIRAVGQIDSKKVLMQEEVNQLAESFPGTNGIFDDAYGGGANRRKLQAAGKITANSAISVFLAGMQKKFGGGMDVQSQQLLGLSSTLKSRPQRIMGMLNDNGSLEPVKGLLRNLIDLTDGNKQPGAKLLKGFGDLGKKAITGLFAPLEKATQGGGATRLVDNITSKLNGIGQWWTINGPRMKAEAVGFGDGLRSAADGAGLLVKPLAFIAGALDRMGGGSGDGGGILGKILGFGIGAVVLARIGNFLSFGALGMLGKTAALTLLGKVSMTLAARGGLFGFLRGQVGYLRWLGGMFSGFISRFGLVAFLQQVGIMGARVLPVVGWIVTGMVALKAVGDAMYDRWDGFARLIDGIKGKLDWMLKKPEEQTSWIGRAMAFDPAKWVTGQKQAWEVAVVPGELPEGTIPAPLVDPLKSLRTGGMVSIPLAPNVQTQIGVNGPEVITPDRAAEQVGQNWGTQSALPPINQTLNFHVQGGVNPAAVGAIQQATTGAALNATNIEGGGR